MSITQETARAWVDVDLTALVANARTIAAIAGGRLLPMVKANGYGLGAVPVARALETLDPWGYGVATIEEGAELRAARITRPILVFTPLCNDAIRRFLTHDLRPVIDDAGVLRAWIGATDRPFHLEVDTGMARSGLRWDDPAALAEARALLPGAVGWEGVFTHFHSADTDPKATRTQWDRFQSVVGAFPRRPELVHAANSAAALCGSRYTGDLIRPGIFLYGGSAGTPAPRPVAVLGARVVGLRAVARGETVSYGATWAAERETTVATLAIGYADGVPRALGNRGSVEIRGRVLPIVGRVTMDLTMIAPAEGCAIGDAASLYGGLVTLDAQAEAAQTISYELLTAIGARVIRRYSAGP